MKDIVAGCDKQFPKGDSRTQKAVFAVLRFGFHSKLACPPDLSRFPSLRSELVLVRRGDLDIDKIMPHVITGIEVKVSRGHEDRKSPT
mgnify:CR=1 FL=1